ncbi:MAG: hypothetical protein R6U96_18625 [Promethearchaeia archaeon]
MQEKEKKSFFDWEQQFTKKEKEKSRMGIPAKEYEKIMEKFRKDLPDDI